MSIIPESDKETAMNIIRGIEHTLDILRLRLRKDYVATTEAIRYPLEELITDATELDALLMSDTWGL